MKLLHLTGPAPFFTNSFLLVSAGEAAIIDPAPDAARFAPLLEKENARLTHILLTHGHFDHVYGLDSVRAAWPEARLCMFCQDATGTPDDRPVPASPDIVCLTDGQTLTVGEATITVLHTPGHTPGSCCYLCEGVLVSGDTLFAGGVGRTDFAGGDWQALMNSLHRLADDPSLPDDLQVLPGHGPFTTLGQERAQNPYMKG